MFYLERSDIVFTPFVHSAWLNDLPVLVNQECFQDALLETRFYEDWTSIATSFSSVWKKYNAIISV